MQGHMHITSTRYHRMVIGNELHMAACATSSNKMAVTKYDRHSVCQAAQLHVFQCIAICHS